MDKEGFNIQDQMQCPREESLPELFQSFKGFDIYYRRGGPGRNRGSMKNFKGKKIRFKNFASKWGSTKKIDFLKNLTRPPPLR